MNLYQNHLHSLHQNHLYSLQQNIHQNLQHLHHQKKKHGSGSKHHSAGLIKYKKLLPKYKSHGRKHEEKKKILGVGHLKSLKEAEKENTIYN